MESLYLLIPIAVIIVAIAVGVLFWAVKNGQYEDLDAEGKRILFDQAPSIKPDKKVTAASDKKTP